MSSEQGDPIKDCLADGTCENRGMINRLRAELAKWQTLANQGITIEAELRRDNLFLEREIERLKLQLRIEESRRALNASNTSVRCPHCHWGFHPSVIDQHIREKH